LLNKTVLAVLERRGFGFDSQLWSDDFSPHYLCTRFEVIFSTNPRGPKVF